MKKIGIVTLYYKNHNYGGLLQAYALSTYLNDCGYKSEQLSWDFNHGFDPYGFQTIKNKSLKSKIKLSIYNVLYLFNKRNKQKRAKAFEEFESIVPHSKTVYTEDNISESVKDYDAFIVGSDQVWNMDWYHPEHFLDFVPEEIPKISYASSMPNTNLTEEQREIVKNSLSRFQGISVREQDCAKTLSSKTGQNIEWTLDPTLLLDRSQWERIAKPYDIKGKYIFCFFIGANSNMREIAKEFSKKTKLPIVSFPHLSYTNISDFTFGDVRIFDAGPDSFISIIKNAEYVITDSFHATVFSNIFKTKYFVFSRKGSGKMDSRVTSLLDMFNSSERFCHSENLNVDYMMNIKDKEVEGINDKFTQMQEKSKEFLKNNLGK